MLAAFVVLSLTVWDCDTGLKLYAVEIPMMGFSVSGNRIEDCRQKGVEMGTQMSAYFRQNYPNASSNVNCHWEKGEVNVNPTQVGNLIKSGLLALGVSSSVIGYVSAEAWIAVGGAVVAVGTVIWQIVASKTAKLIEAVAREPEVVKVVVDDRELAKAIPSPKVVPLT